MSTTPALSAVCLAAIAEPLVEVFLRSERVPKNEAVHQTRRDIKCGRAKPLHMMISVSLDEADDVEIPIGQVIETYELIIELVKERRRQALERQSGGATHAIAGPSLLGPINREDRFEHAENDAERAVLADENDPDALNRLLTTSKAEQHEQQRRDRIVTRHLARTLLRRAAVGA